MELDSIEALEEAVSNGKTPIYEESVTNTTIVFEGTAMNPVSYVTVTHAYGEIHEAIHWTVLGKQHLPEDIEFDKNPHLVELIYTAIQ